MPQARSVMTVFKLSEREIWPGCREIAVTGELDRAVVRELALALERAAADGLDVLLDFAECAFIDLSGVEVLVRCDKELASQGRQLLLCGTAGQVRRVLWVTGLAGVNHGPALPLDRPSRGLAPAPAG
jgi:anti-anti-sigma factor